MKKLTLLVCTLLLAWTARAQHFQIDQTAKQEVMKLAFLLGEWEGQGWRMAPDGSRHTFSQTEKIQIKLDSTAILVEGVGKADGTIIHNALAVITYDGKENGYSFRSWLANGRGGEFEAELIDHKFYWYPNDNMRYIIWLNEEGQWYETGEIDRDGEWIQFFEMTLDRK